VLAGDGEENGWIGTGPPAEDGTADMSSRPRRSPNRTAVRTEHRILALRFNRRWGRTVFTVHLRPAHSTVSKVLARYRMPRLACQDQDTGLPGRLPARQRNEHEYPGDLVHVDIKTLGRIPNVSRTAAGAALLDGVRVPRPRRRRPLSAGVFRNPRRREQGNRCRVLDPRGRLLHQPRHHRQGRAHRAATYNGCLHHHRTHTGF
jgi:hypothetical protein